MTLTELAWAWWEFENDPRTPEKVREIAHRVGVDCTALALQYER